MIDSLFNLSSESKVQAQALKILHGTTDEVIKNAREKFKEKNKNDNNNNINNLDETFGNYIICCVCVTTK